MNTPVATITHKSVKSICSKCNRHHYLPVEFAERSVCEACSIEFPMHETSTYQVREAVALNDDERHKVRTALLLRAYQHRMDGFKAMSRGDDTVFYSHVTSAEEYRALAQRFMS